MENMIVRIILHFLTDRQNTDVFAVLSVFVTWQSVRFAELHNNGPVITLPTASYRRHKLAACALPSQDKLFSVDRFLTVLYDTL